MDIPKKFKNRSAGFCILHTQGPLDVWYDCTECCKGSREDALLYWQWMPISQILDELTPERRERWLKWANS